LQTYFAFVYKPCARPQPASLKRWPSLFTQPRLLTFERLRRICHLQLYSIIAFVLKHHPPAALEVYVFWFTQDMDEPSAIKRVSKAMRGAIDPSKMRASLYQNPEPLVLGLIILNNV
jgi:hypothetical protein